MLDIIFKPLKLAEFKTLNIIMKCGYCIVPPPSTYSFWLTPWYLSTFLENATLRNALLQGSKYH